MVSSASHQIFILSGVKNLSCGFHIVNFWMYEGNRKTNISHFYLCTLLLLLPNPKFKKPKFNLTMMNIKKTGLLFLSVLILSVNSLRADEGMWMLPLIQKLNSKEMSKIG